MRLLTCTYKAKSARRKKRKEILRRRLSTSPDQLRKERHMKEEIKLPVVLGSGATYCGNLWEERFKVLRLPAVYLPNEGS